jgi:hypothetical protein
VADPCKASDDNWMTLLGEACPVCDSEGNRRVLVDLNCPRWMGPDDRLMACMGCGNAARFECRAPDEDGDLFEAGCGWWFQYPLHPRASEYPSMGRAPSWNYKRYRS